MIAAPWTAVHSTPNKSIRQAVPRRGVVLHGAAMTSLAGLRRLAMGAKEVSATAICKDDQLELLMGDRYRAWSLADAWGDSSFRSIECANESVEGWTFSDASIWSMSRAIAYWSQQDGFYPQRAGTDRRRWTVIGHREFHDIYGGSYPTACPQSMNLDLATRRAQGLLLGSAIAGGGTRPIPIIEEDEMKVVFGHRKEGGDEWLIGHVDLRGELPLERGFLVTTDPDEAKAWGRTYAEGSNDYDFDVNRKDYIAIQKGLTRAYDAKSRAEAERTGS